MKVPYIQNRDITKQKQRRDWHLTQSRQNMGSPTSRTARTVINPRLKPAIHTPSLNFNLFAEDAAQRLSKHNSSSPSLARLELESLSPASSLSHALWSHVGGAAGSCDLGARSLAWGGKLYLGFNLKSRRWRRSSTSLHGDIDATDRRGSPRRCPVLRRRKQRKLIAESCGQFYDKCPCVKHALCVQGTIDILGRYG